MQPFNLSAKELKNLEVDVIDIAMDPFPEKDYKVGLAGRRWLVVACGLYFCLFWFACVRFRCCFFFYMIGWCLFSRYLYSFLRLPSPPPLVLPNSRQKAEEDPTLVKSSKTGRGPLTDPNWSQTMEPMMCCYKVSHRWAGEG